MTNRRKITDNQLKQIPKYKTFDELSTVVQEAKARGKVIVLANGGFDILHVGHVRYLQAARQLGDILIVAINSDISVKKIKGADRPVLCEIDRVTVVAAVEAVDYITTFDDEKVSQLLRLLKPDFHAKGTDYRSPSEVPEADVVAEYGGQTAIVGDPKDHSTTDIIAKIRSL